MKRTASISPDEKYRYMLMRRWAEGSTMSFIMLNPSTADARIDDPTIRRCIQFARRNGCTAIAVYNLFAYRTPHPNDLKVVEDPVGPLNNLHLATLAKAYHADFSVTPANRLQSVVVAWGQGGAYLRRDKAVEEIFKKFHVPLMCLGTNKDGSPKHPLYVPGKTALEPWASR